MLTANEDLHILSLNFHGNAYSSAHSVKYLQSTYSAPGCAVKMKWSVMKMGAWPHGRSTASPSAPDKRTAACRRGVVYSRARGWKAGKFNTGAKLVAPTV